MSDIQISASEFATTREVDITQLDEKGKELVHTYTVRKGAGSDLDISMLSSRLVSASQKIINTRNKLMKAKESEQGAILTEIEEQMNEVQSLQAKLSDRYISLFDDHEGGAKTKLLLQQVGVEGLRKMLDRIFE